MTPIQQSTKLRLYLAACVAWLGCAAWLVGCVVVAAPARVGAGAVLSLVLLGIVIGLIKHDMELDAIRARARPSVDPSEDLFSK